METPKIPFRVFIMQTRKENLRNKKVPSLLPPRAQRLFFVFIPIRPRVWARVVAAVTMTTKKNWEFGLVELV